MNIQVDIYVQMTVILQVSQFNKMMFDDFDDIRKSILNISNNLYRDCIANMTPQHQSELFFNRSGPSNIGISKLITRSASGVDVAALADNLRTSTPYFAGFDYLSAADSKL